MDPVTLICGALILVGVFGVVVPVIPGLAMVVLGVGIWTTEKYTGPASLWPVLVCLGIWAAALVAEYAGGGRRLRTAGVPWRTQLAGAAVGVVGMFVIPVVGIVLGFPLGIYLAERARTRDGQVAWASTKHALRALGRNILIELAAAMTMVAVFVTAVLTR